MQKFKRFFASASLVALTLAMGAALLTPAHQAKAAFDTADMQYVTDISASSVSMMKDVGTAGFFIMGHTIPVWMGVSIAFGIVAVVVTLVVGSLGGFKRIFGGRKRR